MIWLVAIVVAVVVAIVAILFLNRFYKKATREVALVRTGAGGQKVVLDGGCLALPILHKVSEVNMRTSRLEIVRSGEKSVITADRLRVDTTAEFYLRVASTPAGVATAAQALGSKTFRPAEMAETLEGKLIDAILSVAAGYTMDALQDDRGKYAAEVTALLEPKLAQNGLVLESVSVTRLDQTPFRALDENNAFNALGMRRLAEIIATNKKERAAIEADSEVAVRQSQLEASKRRLLIEQEEEEAQIAQQLHVETRRADSQAKIAEEQAAADERREQARIDREREVRAAEIARDRALRRLELDASQATEVAKIDKEIVLAAKRSEEAQARAESEAARADEIAAQQMVETTRERAAAERDKLLAQIRADEQAAVDDTRVRSEAGTVLAMAEAKAQATSIRARAEKEELVARAEGRSAEIAAENRLNPEVIRMKLDLAKLQALPDIVGKMMKPAEKIDSIRINHITGFGGTGGGPGGGGSAGGGDKAVVNQVVDGILAMALQLPAVRKLGEEVGLNIGDGLKGLGQSASLTDEEGESPPEDQGTG